MKIDDLPEELLVPFSLFVLIVGLALAAGAGLGAGMALEAVENAVQGARAAN